MTASDTPDAAASVAASARTGLSADPSLTARAVPHVLTHDGIDLAWYSWGEPTGIPVVLQHGFAADTHTNWVVPGLVGDLVDAGRWVVGLDARGHGASQPVHDPERVGHLTSALDVMALIDLLIGESAADVVDFAGYSMGAHIGMHVLTNDTRVRRAVIAGVGVTAGGGSEPDGRKQSVNRAAIADAMERYVREPGLDAKTAFDDRDARDFVRYARYTGADMLSLVAYQRAAPTSLGGVESIAADVLVLAGADDHLARSADALRALIPGASLVITPGSHLSAVGEPDFRNALRSFLCA